MKRSLRNSAEPVAKRTRSHNPKLTHEWVKKKRTIYTPWISATKTRNFFFNDHLCDWLKLYGGRTRSNSSGNFTNNNNNNNTFSSYIKRKGIEFETQIIKLLAQKFHLVTVSDVYNASQIDKTIEYMKQGIPIIHSAPLSNKKNKTYGIADLLVRNDILNQLIDTPVDIEEGRASKLGVDYYYVVIDIKYQTLKLKSDGIHLLNNNAIRAYKAQTWIYNEAVGLIQGFTPSCAYILGRRWIYKSKGEKFMNESCFSRLGVIDFVNMDKFVTMQIRFALKWNREVIKYGAKWIVNPPSRIELYPTIGVDSGKFNSFKKNLANELGEITMLWQCNIKNRKIAISNGIMSWKDPKCTGNKLGMSGAYENTVNKIITINQGDIKITPHKIRNNIGNWQVKNRKEFFIDFETFSDICQPFDSLPVQKRFNRIYLIGIGWLENGIWNYKKLITKYNTDVEEANIIVQLYTFLMQYNNPSLFYWHAEKNFLKYSINCNDKINNNLIRLLDFNWIDMCNLFRKEPIAIKGCFGFGLKEIAKNMIKHKLIDIKMESDCTNGMTAMVRAWKCYKDYSDPTNAPIMLDIIKYNEFDVKVLCKILDYLRSNHL